MASQTTSMSSWPELSYLPICKKVWESVLWFFFFCYSCLFLSILGGRWMNEMGLRRLVVWNTCQGQGVRWGNVPSSQRCESVACSGKLVLFWEKNEFIALMNLCGNVWVDNSQNIWAGSLIWKQCVSRWYLKLWWHGDGWVSADKTWEKGRMWALGRSYL